MSLGSPLASFGSQLNQTIAGQTSPLQQGLQLGGQLQQIQSQQQSREIQAQQAQLQQQQAAQQQSVQNLGMAEKLLKLGVGSKNQELLDIAGDLITRDPGLNQAIGAEGLSFKLDDLGRLGVKATSVVDRQRLIGLAEQQLDAIGDIEGTVDVDGSSIPILSTSEKARRTAAATAEARLPFQEKTALRQRETAILAQKRDLPERFLNRQRVKKLSDSLGAASSLQEVVRAGNPLGDEFSKRQLLKLAGDAGNLSKSEVEAFGGSPALFRQIKRLESRLVSGIIPPEDRQDVITLLDILVRKNNSALQGESRAFSQSQGRALGVEPSEIEGLIQPEVENLLRLGVATPTPAAQPTAPTQSVAPLQPGETRQFGKFKIRLKPQEPATPAGDVSARVPGENIGAL